jgi:hypothetical protein
MLGTVTEESPKEDLVAVIAAVAVVIGMLSRKT